MNSNLHEEFEIKDEVIEIEEKETVNSSDKIKTKMAVKPKSCGTSSNKQKNQSHKAWFWLQNNNSEPKSGGMSISAKCMLPLQPPCPFPYNFVTNITGFPQAKKDQRSLRLWY